MLIVCKTLLQWGGPHQCHQWFCATQEKKRILTCQNEELQVPKIHELKFCCFFHNLFLLCHFCFTFCFRKDASSLLFFHQFEYECKMPRLVHSLQCFIPWNLQLHWCNRQLFCSIKTTTKTMTTSITMTKMVIIVFKGISVVTGCRRFSQKQRGDR